MKISILHLYGKPITLITDHQPGIWGFTVHRKEFGSCTDAEMDFVSGRHRYKIQMDTPPCKCRWHAWLTAGRENACESHKCSSSEAFLSQLKLFKGKPGEAVTGALLHKMTGMHSRKPALATLPVPR